MFKSCKSILIPRILWPMKLTTRQKVAFVAIGLVATSCGGSSEVEPAAPLVEDTVVPTTVELAKELPGNGDVVYASEDVMCNQEAEGKLLEGQIECPEGTTDYWFMTDNTLVIDISNFDDEDEVEFTHRGSPTFSFEWDKAEGFNVTDRSERYKDLVRTDGDYLVITTDLCAWKDRFVLAENGAYPSPQAYFSLQFSLNYEYSPVTIESNGLIVETEDPSLYHSFQTNPLERDLMAYQRGNQAVYDHIHENAEGCELEYDPTSPTTPVGEWNGVGRPDA